MEEIDGDGAVHPEQETLVDPEIKKRRSSIRKQKLGNQSDLSPDTVSYKSSRRVSFASSNFVKPFASDPEKNTVWDNTYEEEVNHTDSTKSNEETQATCTSGRMDMTSFQIWESKSVVYAIPETVDSSNKENCVPIIKAACGNDTNLNQTEMEFTGTYATNSNQSDMEFTGNYSKFYPYPSKINLVAYVQNQKKRAHMSCNVTMLDMSFTCGFPIEQEKNHVETQMNKTMHTVDDVVTLSPQDEEDEMEFTTISITNPIVNTNFNKEVNIVTNMTTSKHVVTLSPQDQEDEMEFTTISNTNPIVNTNFNKEVDIARNMTTSKHDSNETNGQTVDMEFTSHLTSVVEEVSETCVQNDDNSLADMEFTTLQAVVDDGDILGEEQTTKPANILYSQPIKSILKRNDISCNAITPTGSFVMSLNSMSPCTETTQQLIQATFSKPESINNLLKGRNAETKCLGDYSVNKSDSNEISAKKKMIFKDSETELPNKHGEIEDIGLESKSISDTTPPCLVDEDSVLPDTDSPEIVNSTLESKEVLPNTEKYMTYMKIDFDDDDEAEKTCDLLWQEYEENTKALKNTIENFRFPVFEVVDFEELLKEVTEESSSSQISEGALNDSRNYRSRPSMSDMVVPMSLYERVCEAASRCEKFWKFSSKSDETNYCFFGCFDAVPFKVVVHPELGKVYSVKTYNNLREESIGLTHYEAKVFTMKLQQDHLLPHLGPNFDLLTLLDYVCLCTDEIEKFHSEFNELKNKYGYSHKLNMHRDNSVTFEILHVQYIIWWKISVKLSTQNLGHIEFVSATHELDEEVNEGHIKSIAEKCERGPHHLRCFIEKVDEYVQKIGKKISMRREVARRNREL